MKPISIEHIRSLDPCTSGRLLETYPDATHVTYADVIDSNGIADTLRLLRGTTSADQFGQIILRFVLVTERSRPAFKAQYPDDTSVKAVYDLIRRRIAGENISSNEFVNAADVSAYAAAHAAHAAADATADVVARAAYVVAYVVAYVAADAAADAVADAVADVVAHAANAAACVSDDPEAERQYQKEHLKQVIAEVLDDRRKKEEC